jgi:acyl-CoA thioester hydrolase
MSLTEAPKSVLHLQVRDYECDMGQVVNNAVYLSYLEHARHDLLRRVGVSFGELARRGIFLVVTRIEADFKGSLIAADRFSIQTSFSRKGRLRLQFTQNIFRTEDGRLMLSATVTGTAVNSQGKPEIHPELELALNKLNAGLG